MMMPSIFGENLFDDDWMNFPFDQDFWGKKNPLYGKHVKNMMKTDIREHEKGYEVDIDLPGFKKDEIGIETGRKLLDKDVQVRKKEDAKYKKRTACFLLCLSYRCECPGWVRDPDFLKENDNT